MQTQEQVNKQMIDELEQVRKANRTIVDRVALLCAGFLIICTALAVPFSKTFRDKPVEPVAVESEENTSLFDDEITVYLP